MKNTVINKILILLLFSYTKDCISQQNVCSVHTRIQHNEEYYFGLKKGDQLNIDLSVNSSNGKISSVDNVELFAYPNTLIWSSYKPSNLKQELPVNMDGIYFLKITHTGLGARIVDLDAKRVNSSSMEFNPIVFWRDQIDTNYFYKTEKYINKIDTVPVVISDKRFYLNSKTNLTTQITKTTIELNIPENTHSVLYSFSTSKNDGSSNSQTSGFDFMSVLSGFMGIPDLSLISGLIPKGEGAINVFRFRDLTNATLWSNGMECYYISEELGVTEGTNIIDNIALSQQNASVIGLLATINSLTPNLPARKEYVGIENPQLRDGLFIDFSAVAFQLKYDIRERSILNYTLKSQKVPYLMN